MPRDTRRSGLSLILSGLGAIIYFWITDPRWGGRGRSPVDIVDLVSQARPGTCVGIVGGAVIAIIGVWLMVRRTA